MIRIANAVNAHDTASDVNWLYVGKLAHANTKHLYADVLKEQSYDQFYKNLLAVGDAIVEYIVPLAEKVPGAGFLVRAAAELYTGVREFFEGPKK